MNINFSLNNLFDFRRFTEKKFSISDFINYSIIFLAVLAVMLLFFDIYIFYLYIFGFGFSPDEKNIISFSEVDYKRAVQIIDEREKLFNDITAEKQAGSPNPFR